MMELRRRYLVPALVTAATSFGLIMAAPATADCTSSGGATICAQGDVRGGSGSGPSMSGPVYPYPCEDDWLCNDGVDVVFGPIWPGGPGRPGGPGGGGGIGGGGGVGPR